LYFVSVIKFWVFNLQASATLPLFFTFIVETLSRSCTKKKKKKKNFTNMQTTLPAGPLVETVQVTHPDAHLYCAIAIFGDKVTALQLVWADRRGRWPWAADFDEGRGTQPVLGMRATRRSA
ncbi:DUF4262 domain-containing protein, partial [Mycobacterium tuberculosis]